CFVRQHAVSTLIFTLSLHDALPIFDALLNPWNVALGLAVFFLARVQGLLYFLNNINDEELNLRTRKALIPNALLFLVFFLSFVRSEEHTSELQSRENLVCRLLLEKK